MSVSTPIQWCDSAVNPVMGCDGCELWAGPVELERAINSALWAERHMLAPMDQIRIWEILEEHLPSDIYHARRLIATRLARRVCGESQNCREVVEDRIERAIAAQFKCYAGLLHLRHGVDHLKPAKRTNRGYAPKFENVTLFPGRMREAAKWSDLHDQTRPEKPWLNDYPRLVFVSDMADALSRQVPFEYLKKEIIDTASSADGSRHLWLWLTKQPRRMVQLSDWLFLNGIPWPENIVAMTSITSQRTAGRVSQLKQVRSRFKGLSIEPLWERVMLDLNGIDWVIVGGESAIPRANAQVFDLAWARDLRAQCNLAKVAFFVKQLGSRPMENGKTIGIKHGHGGNWEEWPADLRIREIPQGFRELQGTQPSLAQNS